jgi:hypothetical protein
MLIPAGDDMLNEVELFSNADSLMPMGSVASAVSRSISLHFSSEQSQDLGNSLGPTVTLHAPCNKVSIVYDVLLAVPLLAGNLKVSFANVG